VRPAADGIRLRSAERPATGRRTSIPLTVALILVAFALVLATLLGPPSATPDTPRIDFVTQNGDLVITNSLEGDPIVSMANMAPGETASGDVTLENTGTARGFFYLAPQDLVSVPGPGGGDLADVLIMRITFVKAGRTRRVYHGPLSQMGTRQVGRFRPGESATYSFDVHFHSKGPAGRPNPSRPYRGDNKYQSSSASVTFGWATAP
jgi:hypothetical protein